MAEDREKALVQMCEDIKTRSKELDELSVKFKNMTSGKQDYGRLSDMVEEAKKWLDQLEGYAREDGLISEEGCLAELVDSGES